MASTGQCDPRGICNAIVAKRLTVKSIIPHLFAFVAFILTWISQFSCDFLRFTSISNGLEEPISLHFGVWSYEFWNAITTTLKTTNSSSPSFSDTLENDNNLGDDETAEQGGAGDEGGEILIFIFHLNREYPKDIQIDSYWRASRAFGTLALILGGILALNRVYFVFMGSRMRIPGIIETICYFTCCLFQGLSLLLMKSDLCNNNFMMKGLNLYFPRLCEMGIGAKSSVAAVVLWFLAAIFSHPYEVTKVHQMPPSPEQQTDIEEMNNDNEHNEFNP